MKNGAMGHGYAVANTIRQPDYQVAWKEIIPHPLPKLLSGFESAFNVSASMYVGKQASKMCEWMEQMGYTDGVKAVKGTICTISNISACSDEETARQNATLEAMQAELASEGCKIAVMNHTCQHNGETVTQFALFLPDEKPNIKSDPFNEDQKRIPTTSEERVQFLAYLLRNNLIKPEEAMGSDENILFRPFGMQFLGQAERRITAVEFSKSAAAAM